MMKTGLFTDGLGDAYGPHYGDLRVGDWVKIVGTGSVPQPAGEDLFGRIEGRDGLRWKVRCESGALWYAEGKHLALNVWATIDPAVQKAAPPRTAHSATAIEEFAFRWPTRSTSYAETMDLIEKARAEGYAAGREEARLAMKDAIDAAFWGATIDPAVQARTEAT